MGRTLYTFLPVPRLWPDPVALHGRPSLASRSGPLSVPVASPSGRLQGVHLSSHRFPNELPFQRHFTQNVLLENVLLFSSVCQPFEGPFESPGRLEDDHNTESLWKELLQLGFADMHTPTYQQLPCIGVLRTHTLEIHPSFTS